MNQETEIAINKGASLWARNARHHLEPLHIAVHSLEEAIAEAMTWAAKQRLAKAKGLPYLNFSPTHYEVRKAHTHEVLATFRVVTLIGTDDQPAPAQPATPDVEGWLLDRAKQGRMPNATLLADADGTPFLFDPDEGTRYRIMLAEQYDPAAQGRA